MNQFARRDDVTLFLVPLNVLVAPKPDKISSKKCTPTVALLVYADVRVCAYQQTFHTCLLDVCEIQRKRSSRPVCDPSYDREGRGYSGSPLARHPEANRRWKQLRTIVRTSLLFRQINAHS